jgi:prolyl-tRNA editing enzyme YbaK/EbsC (Cys-tRNA(Pro) deacylase)
MTAIVQHLQANGARFWVAPHEATYSSLAEARELGIRADEVIKTVMLATTSGHVAAIIPASTRVNARKLEQLLFVDDARLATEEEIREDFPYFDLGCLPPIPSLLGVPTVVDPEVTLHERVAFAVSPTESIEVEVADLFKGEHLTLAPVARRLEFEEAFAG